MRTKAKKLEFKKEAVVELHDDTLFTVRGGTFSDCPLSHTSTGPLCDWVKDLVEELQAN